MSDREFEAAFGPKTIEDAVPEEAKPAAQPPPDGFPDASPFMPSYACKQETNEEQAYELAMAWWEHR